jgi:hypothetical protein
VLQVVPIPIDCVQELRDAFTQCSEEENIELNEIPKHSDLKQVKLIKKKRREEISDKAEKMKDDFFQLIN